MAFTNYLKGFPAHKISLGHIAIDHKKRTVLLHDRQELDNDLGGRTDKNLTLATLLSIDDVVQAIVLRISSVA